MTNKVLMIDDDENICRLVKLNLEKGYLTIAGRINRQYFAERFYGIKSTENGALREEES